MPEDPLELPPAALPESLPSVASEVSGLPRNVAAALATMIPLVGGLVFLFLEKRDRLVRFYSIQSIVLGSLIAVALVIRMLVIWIFEPVPLLGDPAVYLVNIIFRLFAAVGLGIYLTALVMAFRGREWSIPYLGGMGKRPGTR